MIKSVLAVLVLGMLGGAWAQTRGEHNASALRVSSTGMQAAAHAPLRDIAGAPDKSALRAAFDHAVWPGDIVRAADAYLLADPGAADVAAQRQAAAEVLQLLRGKDVMVFRSSFIAEDPALQRDLRLAAVGDRAAAVRLAEASRAYDEAHGTRRYVGWMQLASLLRDPQASYRLALHFRRSGQPALAAQYEATALALGHVPLTSLDNVRK